MMTRRRLLGHTARAASGLALAGLAREASFATSAEPLFKISLAQWSLRDALFSGRLDHLDFPKTARRDYGIEAVELVNRFFMDRAQDKAYLRQLKARAGDEGVRILLIMCDGEGSLGDPEAGKQAQAIDNHKKWVEAARLLGCQSIRVNASGKSSDAGPGSSAQQGSDAEQQQRVADGIRRLCEFAEPHAIDVLVENHGGLSSNGRWLAGVMKLVDHPRCGTLPDFGNFQLDGEEWYDRYRGVAELMPYAKGVSAKSLDFDDAGNETSTDYLRMMKIVLDAGYRGYVGIEYGGERLSGPDGIRATHALLKRVRAQLAEEYQK